MSGRLPRLLALVREQALPASSLALQEWRVHWPSVPMQLAWLPAERWLPRMLERPQAHSELTLEQRATPPAWQLWGAPEEEGFLQAHRRAGSSRYPD
ncbi:MAG TPA: hypothetical protein VES96_07730 [Nitrospiraceae bacterium]|nr:hypothetical protein [Nitrospiraceae bacterium]